MKISRAIRFTTLFALLTGALNSTSRSAYAQATQIQGVINGRSGATLTVQTVESPSTVVLLTASTSVGEVQGVFKA
jgi:OmpA-OmpF porin, OOP family